MRIENWEEMIWNPHFMSDMKYLFLMVIHCCVPSHSQPSWLELFNDDFVFSQWYGAASGLGSADDPLAGLAWCHGGDYCSLAGRQMLGCWCWCWLGFPSHGFPCSRMRLQVHKVVLKSGWNGQKPPTNTPHLNATSTSQVPSGSYHQCVVVANKM